MEREVIFNLDYGKIILLSLSKIIQRKGIAIFDETRGFHILHSIPGFPTYNSTHLSSILPDSALTNGQHLFCFTSDTTEIEKFANLLVIDRPFPMIASRLPS